MTTPVVLQLAAICGTEFDLGTVAHAAGQAPPLVERAGVLTAITTAEADGTIVAVARSTTRYRFADPTTATELVDGLPLATRLDLRRRVANALDRAGADVVTVAEHRLLAAPLDPAAAVTAGRRGALAAMQRGRFDDGARLYALVLDAQVLDPDLDLADRADVLVALGEAQAAAGRRDEALGSFRAALALDIAHPARAALAARAATSYSDWPSQPERDTEDPGLRALADAALAALGDDDSAARAITLARLGQTARWAADVERGRAQIAEAAAIAERTGDPAARAVVLVAQRLVTITPEHAEDRLALSTAALPLARSASRRDLPLALFLHAADHLEAGNLGAATATVAQLVDEAERNGTPGSWWFARRFEASLALLAGRLDRAEELATDALRFGARAQHQRAQVSYELQLLHCRAATGGVDERLTYWRDVADTSPWHRATYAWAAAIAGETDDARAAVGDVLALGLDGQPRNAGWLPLLATAADVVVDVELDAPLAELRVLIEPHAARVVTVFNGLVCLGSLERVAGRLALAAGDLADAERHLRAAVAAHDRLGAVLLAATSRADLATALRRRGDAATADALVEQALGACRARGATALAARIGTPRTHPAAASDDVLSPREVEVLRLLAAGLTNKQIAQQLHISAATVQRHTINLYRKIGAAGRSDAAVYAAQRHLLD